MSKEKKSIGLLHDGGRVDLDIKEPSVGPDVLDLNNFSAATGLYTFDPSYRSTASCESYVTYVDGMAGVSFMVGGASLMTQFLRKPVKPLRNFMHSLGKPVTCLGKPMDSLRMPTTSFRKPINSIHIKDARLAL